MTKKELIEHVNALPDNITFLVSSDEEGNSYREADVGPVEKAFYDDEWVTVHPDDLEEYSDRELIDVVVFW